VRLHHIDDINVFEKLHSRFACFCKQIARELVFGNEHHIANFLWQIDHFVGLQTLSMQPPHMQHQHLA